MLLFNGPPIRVGFELGSIASKSERNESEQSNSSEPSRAEMCVLHFFLHVVYSGLQNSGKTQFTVHCRCWYSLRSIDCFIGPQQHFNHQSNRRCTWRASHDMTRNQRCSIWRAACDFRKWNTNIHGELNYWFNSVQFSLFIAILFILFAIYLFLSCN